MSLLGRIDQLRKQREKLSINKLEQECGLTRGSMAKWDDHAPSADKVKKVADYFNVSAEYLLYGTSPDVEKNHPVTNDDRMNPDYLKLNAANRAAIDAAIAAFLASQRLDD